MPDTENADEVGGDETSSYRRACVDSGWQMEALA